MFCLYLCGAGWQCGTLDSQLESGFESSCCHFEAWAISFTQQLQRGCVLPIDAELALE